MVEQADDAFDENALAGSTSPDDHHGFAAFDLQIRPAQDMVLAEGLINVLDLDHDLIRASPALFSILAFWLSFHLSPHSAILKK
jgi:hypothetical protein